MRGAGGTKETDRWERSAEKEKKKDDANQFHERMSPLRAICLRRFLFVSVILSLASLSRFPLELGFCPAPGMRCYCCDIRAVHPVRTGLRSLRHSPFREENYKQVNV